MSQLRILVVEDDTAIRTGICHALRFNGYALVEAPDAATARAALSEGDLDLALLDLNLPDGDGLDLLAERRAAGDALPVIVLTARGEEEARVKGLRQGADDYVVKPFGALELLARIEAVLRRSPQRPKPELHLALPGCELDLGLRQLLFPGETPTPLTEREAELLTYLVRHRDRAVDRDEILAQVWHLNPNAVETRTVDMTIARLREKLRDDGTRPRLIQTLRGRGYRFAPEAP